MDSTNHAEVADTLNRAADLIEARGWQSNQDTHFNASVEAFGYNDGEINAVKVLSEGVTS